MTGILETNAADGVPEGFLEIPDLVYRDDPVSIPEEAASVRFAFSRMNPWFAQGRAIALCAPGRARAAAFFDPALRIDGKPAAYFGYFECMLGDQEAAAALIARCERFARENGAAAIFGPVNFTTFGAYRFRVAAEPGAGVFPGEPYSAPHYPALVEGLGYTVSRRYVTDAVPFPEALVERGGKARAAHLAQGYRFEPLTVDLWLAKLPELHRVVDAIFRDNPGYTPIPYPIFAALSGKAYAARACPHTSFLWYGPAGDVAGFTLMYPDYGPLLARGAGAARLRLDEITFAAHEPVLRGRGPVNAIFKTIGVVPEHRRTGLMNAIALHAFEAGRLRYERFLCALIREDNPSRRGIAGAEAVTRVYALYGKGLG